MEIICIKEGTPDGFSQQLSYGPVVHKYRRMYITVWKRGRRETKGVIRSTERERERLRCCLRFASTADAHYDDDFGHS